MGNLVLPCDVGEISDGYHTFNELYEHRCLLFIALCLAHPDKAWRSRLHNDGSEWAGWFIAGLKLPTGDITYHLPEHHWSRLDFAIDTLDRAPAWDGHTSKDVLERLREWMPG